MDNHFDYNYETFKSIFPKFKNLVISFQLEIKILTMRGERMGLLIKINLENRAWPIRYYGQTRSRCNPMKIVERIIRNYKMEFFFFSFF